MPKSDPAAPEKGANSGLSRQDKQRMLETLANLAGAQLDDDSIERSGTSLVLPENMSVRVAIDTLKSYEERQEAEMEFVHRFNARIYDGLVATKRALRRMTGMSFTSRTFHSIFGSYTPPVLNIPIGVGEFEEAPTGEFPLEVFEGSCSTGHWRHEDTGFMFQLTISAPKKYTNAVKGFFALVEEEINTNSIYQGKAFTAGDDPEFLDLKGVDPAKVVYSNEVMTQLDANVWSLLDHSEAMRENGLPLKRAVLLHGPYGTGKTLAAYLTAQRATESGWTFIFVRPGKDSLSDAMATARLYQPAVVFFEDVDITSSPETDVSYLLDIFDGIQAKGTELIAVMTTNHPDRIHKGLVRPGRLDAVIEINSLDAPGIERLIRATVDEKWLPTVLDIEAIAEAMDGFVPAFSREAIDRAVRYSIARNEGNVSVLTSQDFVDAAHGLRPQLDLMNGAADTVVRPDLETVISSIVRTQIDGTWIPTMEARLAEYEEKATVN